MSRSPARVPCYSGKTARLKAGNRAGRPIKPFLGVLWMGDIGVSVNYKCFILRNSSGEDVSIISFLKMEMIPDQVTKNVKNFSIRSKFLKLNFILHNAQY